MAYSELKHAHGTITNFWPDNTLSEMYILGSDGYSLKDILDKAKEHFGECNLDELEITAEHIHTDCLYYDRYDSSDYTNFLKITKITSDQT